MSTVLHEACQHPLLVGLVQTYCDRARAHCEVVSGINTTGRRVFPLDTAQGAREDGFDGFLVEWNAAGRPALVIVPL